MRNTDPGSNRISTKIFYSYMVFLSSLALELWFISITKHRGGGGGGLARRPESKIPKYLSKNSNIRKMLKSYLLNILKVQSESSRISNLVQIFIFTENCTPIIHMNHFSYHLTIVQINIFEEPQSIFSQPKFPDPKLSSQPPPRILTIEWSLWESSKLPPTI